MPRRERTHSYIKTCSGADCTKGTEVDHWTSIKRQAEGWFFQRNGDIWCPAHIPDWVEPWRAAQRAKEETPS